MYRKLTSPWVLLIVAIGLVTISACAHKTVTNESAMTQTAEDEALKAAREAEMARQERLARERALELQQLQEAAAQRELMAARNRFLYEDVYFEYNKADLLPEAQDVISRKALWLYDNPEATVIIEGHCDERGTNEFNMLLGEKRAGNVKTFLIGLGVGPERMLTVSYGEERPVDPAHDEEAWAKNRRVHFLIREAGR
jgi:peptidoglycan-associated lipoprotein